jgi:hypothetical protein
LLENCSVFGNRKGNKHLMKNNISEEVTNERSKGFIKGHQNLIFEENEDLGNYLKYFKTSFVAIN